MKPILCGLGRHLWDGCMCARKGCREKRDAEHRWEGCMCKRCWKTRDADHSWDQCRKCERCGKRHPGIDLYNSARHSWDPLFCEHCRLFRYDGAVVVSNRTGSVLRVAMRTDVLAEAKNALGTLHDGAAAVELACAAVGKGRDVAERIILEQGFQYQTGIGSQFLPTESFGEERVSVVQILSRFL